MDNLDKVERLRWDERPRRRSRRCRRAWVWSAEERRPCRWRSRPPKWRRGVHRLVDPPVWRRTTTDRRHCHGLPRAGVPDECSRSPAGPAEWLAPHRWHPQAISRSCPVWRWQPPKLGRKFRHFGIRDLMFKDDRMFQRYRNAESIAK